MSKLKPNPYYHQKVTEKERTYNYKILCAASGLGVAFRAKANREAYGKRRISQSLQDALIMFSLDYKKAMQDACESHPLNKGDKTK